MVQLQSDTNLDTSTSQDESKFNNTISQEESPESSQKIFNNYLRQFSQFLFVLAIFALACSVLSKFAYERFYQKYFFDNINQLEFIISFTLSSLFPISAIAYLLFQRDTQRRKLARGFWLLGIDVKGDLDRDDLETINTNFRNRSSDSDWDVEAYGEYFKKLENRSNFALNYVAQSIPTILATILGLSLFDWFPRMMSSKPEIFNFTPITLEAMQFGFLGAYIFSIQLVYRRYTTFDLQPIVYMNCTLTMIAGIVFNFVGFQAINALTGDQITQDETGLTGGVLAIVAFSLGYFPFLAIRWFNRVGYKALGEKERRANDLPLGLIDGIGQFHETRLRDEGIDNLQNLASTEIDELLINTRFSAPEVIAWVDQAILYLYLESNEIENFRRGGIRCFTDFRDYWGPYFKAYHTVGTATRKLIETFRHSDESEKSFSGFTDDEFQKLSTKLIKQWETDHQQMQASNRKNVTDSEERNNSNENLLSYLEKERQRLALQLKNTPDYLDALFLSTKTGPNVAHIKHYWKIMEQIANTNRPGQKKYD